MAIINLMGFETGDSSEINSVSGTTSVQSGVTAGSWSVYAMSMDEATGNMRLRALQGSGAGTAGAVTTSYVRWLFRFDGLPATTLTTIVEFLDSTVSVKFGVALNTTGTLSSYDNTGTIMATGSTVLAANTWYRIEVKCGTGATAAWEIKIGGVSEISGTGDLLTTNSAFVTFGAAAALYSDGAGNTTYYDDFLWSDSAYPGDGRCTILKPNANGNYQTWTIGAGAGANHYDKVNETPPDGDTSYLVSDLTSGHAETEALTDSGTAGISGTVNCVKTVGTVKRDGAANGAVTLRTRSGSTDNDTASNFATTTVYTLLAKLFSTDPATSSAWAVAALDSVETGGVEKSTTNKSRMTFTAAMVDWTPSAGTAFVAAPPVVLNQAVKTASLR